MNSSVESERELKKPTKKKTKKTERNSLYKKTKEQHGWKKTNTHQDVSSSFSVVVDLEQKHKGVKTSALSGVLEIFSFLAIHVE